jgi:hypothetical protein
MDYVGIEFYDIGSEYYWILPSLKIIIYWILKLHVNCLCPIFKTTRNMKRDIKRKLGNYVAPI